MTTTNLAGWCYILVLTRIPTPLALRLLVQGLLVYDDHDFALDKHFLVVKFLLPRLLLLKAEPPPRNPPNTDHPPSKS